MVVTSTVPVGHILALLRQNTGCHHHLISHCDQLQGYIIKIGLRQSPPIPVTLLDSYSKSGYLSHARQVFDETPHRDPVLWSALLSSYVRLNSSAVAISLVRCMVGTDRISPDGHILSTLVKACTELCNHRIGKQVHGMFLISDFFNDDVVKSALVNMYSKCGLISDARKVFDDVTSKNDICLTAMVSGYACNGFLSESIGLFRTMPWKKLKTWTAIITGFVRNGDNRGALNLFAEMRDQDVTLSDGHILPTILSAAANLAELALGKQLHCLVMVSGYQNNLFITNTLVDMYAKCSDITTARTIFNSIPIRDTVSWTTMIVGEAHHGQANLALTLFDAMINQTKHKPNEVTFLVLLQACSHAGLVQKGHQMFESMVQNYKIIPSLEHYTAMLDLMSRSGLVSEAEAFLKKIPIPPDEVMWAALLSSCERSGDTNKSIAIADAMLSMKPKEPSTYILLSNTYALSGRWDCVAKTRKLMAEHHRNPTGLSWETTA